MGMLGPLVGLGMLMAIEYQSIGIGRLDRVVRASYSGLGSY